VSVQDTALRMVRESEMEQTGRKGEKTVSVSMEIQFVLVRN
jgi:hypothetical protein